MDTQLLDLSTIRLDGDTQPRVAIDEHVVKEYADLLNRGETFPPIEVICDGAAYWLVDGFHRYHAHRKLERLQIQAVVTGGTLDDARWRSLTANKTHGLRRTNDDKRKAVRKALKMHPDYSDPMLADHVGVSQPTILKYRELMDTEQKAQHAASKAPAASTASGYKFYNPNGRTGKDGRKYPGRRNSAKRAVSRPAMTPIRGPSKPQEEKVYIGFSQDPAMGARAILELLGHDFAQKLHTELVALLAGTAGLAPTLRGTPVDAAS
ncbi:MAG: hypothetical protein WCI73_00315 [Phycisphaerae bacterium]